MTEFFYNNTQRGFCETRVINQTLSLRFVGTDPMVFKPGMPFEAQIAVRYHDQVALTQEQLESSTLLIKATAKLQNGKIVDLPEIKVPKKLEEGFSLFQDIDRLKHYGQVFKNEQFHFYIMHFFFLFTQIVIFLCFNSCTAEVPLRTLTIEIALILPHFLPMTLKATLN